MRCNGTLSSVSRTGLCPKVDNQDSTSTRTRMYCTTDSSPGFMVVRSIPTSLTPVATQPAQPTWADIEVEKACQEGSPMVGFLSCHGRWG